MQPLAGLTIRPSRISLGEQSRVDTWIYSLAFSPCLLSDTFTNTVNSTDSNMYAVSAPIPNFAIKYFPSSVTGHISDSANGYFKMRLSGITSVVICPLADTRTLSCDFCQGCCRGCEAQVYLSTKQ